MKKILFITACVLFGLECTAQIKSFSAAKPIIKEKEREITYDSTRNFVWKDVEELLGQELYAIPQPEKLQKYGYTYFYKEYNRTKDNSYYTKTYELYAGKTFIVDSILPRPYDFSKYWKNYPVLKLREKNEGSVYYYLYNPRDFQMFPFIIMGFYEKEKTQCVGKKLVIKKNKNPWASYYEERDVPIHDVITGLQLEIDPYDIWTIKELIIDQHHGVLAYMITNKKDETLTVALTDVNDYHRLTGPCVLRYDDNLKSIHDKQPEMYKRIMEGKIAIGMTKDMVLMSWGYPANVNDASFGDGWMYSTGQFLYFIDRKLESFQ